MLAAKGGELHSAGSACFTSYMKYKPNVRGAPASREAQMPGWQSVEILLTVSNPASRSMRMVRSQPSFIPRFSAAMEGCLIHVCRRSTAAAWRFAIYARTAGQLPVWALACAWARLQRGHTSAAAGAAAPGKKERRSASAANEHCLHKF